MATSQTSKQSLASIMIVPVLVGVLFTVVFQGYRFEKTKEKHTYNNTTAGILELEIELAKVTKKSSQAHTLTKVTEVVPVFECSTIEMRDAGFLSNRVQSLDQGNTSYVIPNGCMSITLTGDALRGLTGMQVGSGQYLFRYSDAKSSTGYTGCGTMQGVNNSPAECLYFLKKQQGRVIEVINDSEGITLN